MATRIEIELTSRTGEDTFTWRAAGARQPKGVAPASLFPTDAEVGAQFKVEADMDLDGITITNVLPTKGARKRPETLELISRDDEPLVTQQLAEKSRRRDDRRGKGKGRRRDRGDDGDDRGGRGGRGGRGDDGGRGRGRSDRPRTPAKPKLPPKPKAPRLKAGKAHRNALLDGLPEEQKPVAQELLSGGLQAVRSALAKQNEQRATEGQSPIDERPMLELAEKLLNQVRVAEWRDRAEAAVEQAESVDVRDLRSVVTAADGAAKDEETRALAAELRTKLSDRLDAEHNAWVAEITELLDDDRVVRALHQSSRPPKAGAPLPAAIAMRLVEAANAAMTAETTPDRWTYILDALAHSPVRRQVVPASLPTNVTDELKASIARHGSRLPEIAEIFGIEPESRGPRRKRKSKKAGPPKTEAGPGSDGKGVDGKDATGGDGSDTETAEPASASPEGESPRPSTPPSGTAAPAEVPAAAETPDETETAAPEAAAADVSAATGDPADAPAEDTPNPDSSAGD